LISQWRYLTDGVSIFIVGLFSISKNPCPLVIIFVEIANVLLFSPPLLLILLPDIRGTYLPDCAA